MTQRSGLSCQPCPVCADQGTCPRTQSARFLNSVTSHRWGVAIQIPHFPYPQLCNQASDSLTAIVNSTTDTAQHAGTDSPCSKPVARLFFREAQNIICRQDCELLRFCSSLKRSWRVLGYNSVYTVHNVCKLRCPVTCATSSIENPISNKRLAPSRRKS